MYFDIIKLGENMKKGFTLIELLAVIVILAVIALIAIPIVMDIIEDSRKSAAVSSANGYVRAVNYKIAQDQLKDTIVADDDYVIGENSLIVEGNNIKGITGSYTINKGSVLWAGLCVNGYSVEYNSATGYSGINNEGNYCQVETPYVYDFAEEKAYQSLDAMCTGNSADSIYSSTTNYKIEKIEDLVCLSNLVNSGKNFSGKTVYLIEDLDFTSDTSYKDPATTAYGDINGNSTTEGLKVELTTGSGFKPIGTESNKFAGTFDGYAFTIDHLMINRTTAYVGLFGYSNGTIRGIRIRNARVNAGKSSSNSFAGILAGANTAVISSSDVEGDVTGTGNLVGGVLGYIYKSGASNTKITSSLFKGTVQGNSYIGGVVGGADYTSSSTANGSLYVKGVVYDSTLKATATSNITCSYVIGSNPAGLSANVRYYNSSLVGPSSQNSREYEKLITGVTLEAVDGALDTYIGGDNDNDGYYFDYDEDGKITVFSKVRNPIETDKLKGSGTSESPYLINNEKAWKLASALAGQNKYYSVISDIDFANKNFYALGTEENKFNGRINGNMNTISNISIKGNNNLGLFGYNNGGVIEGFKFNNITVSSTGIRVGGIAGTNTGTIKGIVLKNSTITSTGKDNISNSYTGGIAGYNSAVISSVDVEGNITSSWQDVGGITGVVEKSGPSNTNILSVMFKGNVTGYNTVGGITGGGGYSSSSSANGKLGFKGVVYDSNMKITTTQTNNKYCGFSLGYMYNYTDLGSSVKYKNSLLIGVSSQYAYSFESQAASLDAQTVDGALDTYIGGDNDNDGYYFGYCDNSLTLMSKTLNPFDDSACPPLATE